MVKKEEKEEDINEKEKEKDKKEDEKLKEKNENEDDNKIYNDVNYWGNNRCYLNEKEMEDCLNDL